jgi:hypothetical protein
VHRGHRLHRRRDYVNSSSGFYRSLAERWNGSSWAIQPTPTHAGATNIYLRGVSCTAATACTAVGQDYSSGYSLTLAERWNGASWVIQPTPNPANALSVLSSVSCTAATACTAVGDSYSGTYVSLAERWNGTSWAIQSTPNPAGSGSVLSSVSCTAATACTAVGYSGNAVTLAERWNGTSWKIQPTPKLQPVRFHDLRHAAATLMLASGKDLKVVSEVLGHSTIATTANVYAGVLDSLKDDAADRLTRLLAR